jgi:hypothetical protein
MNMKTSVTNLHGFIGGVLFFWLPILILLPGLIACAQKPPTPVAFTNISQYKSGTRVTIAGYLDLYSSFEVSSGTSCVRLRDTPIANKISNGISVWIRNRDYGKDGQPNRIKPLGILYTKDSLVVWLNDGTQVGYGAKVEITGTLHFTDKDIPYINNVTKIE